MKNSYLTVDEISETLKLRKETIRKYIREGHLKAVVLPGGDYRIRTEDFDSFLKYSIANA